MEGDEQHRQAFGPQANALFRGGFAVGGLLSVALIAAVWIYNVWDGYSRGPTVAQPVLFDHEHHASQLGIDCRYCHASADRSEFAGMPSTTACMSCHSQVFTDSPMLQPVRDSLQTGRPLAWQRVHDLKDIVNFNHSIHVNRGVSCVSCHGRVDRMKMAHQAESLSMSWCLECHRNPHEQLVPVHLVTNLEAAEAWLQHPSSHPPEAEEVTSVSALQTYNLTSCFTCHY